MEFRVLKYFLAVAKHENISKAAEALNLTQPTLSRQIADLEAELGTALLVRSKKRTTLTEAGLFLKARAEEIAALADKTVEQLSHVDDLVEGDIYIGCGETEGMAEVIRAIRPLHRSYPRIRVQLTSGNAELVTDRLEKGLLDFALLCRSTPPVEYVYRKLSHEDVWGLFMRRDNPLAVRDSISAEDLLSEPLIVSMQAIESKEFDHWLGQSAENLKIVATYNLAYNSAFLVEQGFGSMLGFAGLISVDAPKRQGIVFRPLLPELHSANYIVWKKGQVFSRAGRLVMAAFEAAFL